MLNKKELKKLGVKKLTPFELKLITIDAIKTIAFTRHLTIFNFQILMKARAYKYLNYNSLSKKGKKKAIHHAVWAMRKAIIDKKITLVD